MLQVSSQPFLHWMSPKLGFLTRVWISCAGSIHLGCSTLCCETWGERGNNVDIQFMLPAVQGVMNNKSFTSCLCLWFRALVSSASTQRLDRLTCQLVSRATSQILYSFWHLLVLLQSLDTETFSFSSNLLIF